MSDVAHDVGDLVVDGELENESSVVPARPALLGEPWDALEANVWRSFTCEAGRCTRNALARSKPLHDGITSPAFHTNRWAAAVKAE